MLAVESLVVFLVVPACVGAVVSAVVRTIGNKAVDADDGLVNATVDGRDGR